MIHSSLQERPAAAASADNIQAQFEALAAGCGVYELRGQAKFAITGSDRVRWLNGMVTNNVRDLAVGRGVYAFLLNPQGRILGDMNIFNLGEWLTVDTDQTQSAAIAETFDRYIIMDDVEVANKSESIGAMRIAGPDAAGVLAAAGFEVPADVLQLVGMNWYGIDLNVVRGDNPAVDVFEIWAAPSELTAVSEALIKAGATAVSEPALEMLRIASGVPRYGKDIRERDLPQETEQARALNFSKGCYVGQEIVERIRSRGAVHRKFTGFVFENGLPEPGTKMQVDGKDVGEITSAASLPLNGGTRQVGLGYIRREIPATAKLDAGGVAAAVAGVPFREFFAQREDSHG